MDFIEKTFNRFKNKEQCVIDDAILYTSLFFKVQRGNLIPQENMHCTVRLLE